MALKVSWPAEAEAPALTAEEQEADRLFAALEVASDSWVLSCQLMQLSHEVVVRRGLLRLPATPHMPGQHISPLRSQVSHSIQEAAMRLVDPPDTVDAAIAVAWEDDPDEQYGPALVQALWPIASYPPLYRRAVETATASVISPRRRTTAIRLLGSAQRFAAESSVLLVALAHLDRTSVQESPWHDELLRSLARLGHPNGFATLTLALAATDDPEIFYNVISGLPKAGGGRAASVLGRLHGVQGANKYDVVRALASISGPEVTDEITAYVTDVLRSYADYPSPNVRVQVADALGARGRLGDVMAIWKSLDACGHESVFRYSALRRLGLENPGDSAAADPHPVDWDALAREKNVYLPELPTVSPALDRLLAADDYVRMEAADALEKGRPPEHLLALVVQFRVEEALYAGCNPYRWLRWNAWRDRLTELGCQAERDPDVVAWVVANAEAAGTGALPTQKMTPGLTAALRDPAAAAAVIAASNRRLTLGADESAALLAEEAEVASRARMPALLQ